MHRRTLTAHVESPWKLAGQYYQAPATLMVESVACGSGGCKLWPASAILGMAQHWHDVPLCLGHPEIQGQPVSVNANGGAIRDAWTVGKVVSPRFCHNTRSLKAVLQIPRDHPRRAEAMALKEVSIGIFSDEVAQEGTFKGKEYGAKVLSATPDHCAIVERGACSWETGCGVRAYSEIDELRRIAGETLSKWIQEIQQNIKQEVGIMSNYQNEAVLPAEVYAANQEKDELETLKSWEGDDNPPMHILELRRKYADKQGQGQDWTGQGYSRGKGYADQAVIPPEIV